MFLYNIRVVGNPHSANYIHLYLSFRLTFVPNFAIHILLNKLVSEHVIMTKQAELAEILRLMSTAVESAWKRNEAVTTMYLELATAKAKTLMEKIDGT